MIYDTIYANSSVNMLPIEARYLYIGTIVLADDDGKLRADHRYIRGRLFSFDENITSEMVKKWLDQLAEIGQIILYEVNGDQILKHPNWKKYQRIRADMRTKSKLPSPLRSCNETVTEMLPNISKDNISKDKEISTSHSDGVDKINPIISLFESVNPSFKRLYANKTQRSAVERLVAEHGYEKTAHMVKELPKIIYKPFAPKVTTPLELERDLGKLITFSRQSKGVVATKGKAVV